MDTLHAYVSNVAKFPLEPKYHRINTENKNYKATLGQHQSCEDLLALIGFQREGTFLVMDATFVKNKGSFVWEVLAKVDFLRS